MIPVSELCLSLDRITDRSPHSYIYTHARTQSHICTRTRNPKVNIIKKKSFNAVQIISLYSLTREKSQISLRRKNKKNPSHSMFLFYEASTHFRTLPAQETIKRINMTSHPPPGAKWYLLVEGAVNESRGIYNSLFRLVVVTGGETTFEDLHICPAVSVDQIIPG